MISLLNIGNLEAVITEDTSTPHPGYKFEYKKMRSKNGFIILNS